MNLQEKICAKIDQKFSSPVHSKKSKTIFIGQKHVNSIFSHGLNCLNTDRSNGDSAEYLDSDNNADKEKKDKILQVHGKPADCLNTNVGEQILQKVSIFLHGEDRLGAGNNYTEEKIHHANEDR